MSKLLFSIIVLFWASILFAGKGEVVVHSDAEGASIYVDGKRSLEVDKCGITSLNLEEADHTIKIVKVLNDQCQRFAQKNIYIGV